MHLKKNIIWKGTKKSLAKSNKKVPKRKQNPAKKKLQRRHLPRQLPKEPTAPTAPTKPKKAKKPRKAKKPKKAKGWKEKEILNMERTTYHEIERVIDLTVLLEVLKTTSVKNEERTKKFMRARTTNYSQQLKHWRKTYCVPFNQSPETTRAVVPRTAMSINLFSLGLLLPYKCCAMGFTKI